MLTSLFISLSLVSGVDFPGFPNGLTPSGNGEGSDSVTSKRAAIAAMWRLEPAVAESGIPELFSIIRSGCAKALHQDAMATICKLGTEKDVFQLIDLMRGELTECAQMKKIKGDKFRWIQSRERNRESCSFFLVSCLPLLGESVRTDQRVLAFVADLEAPELQGWDLPGFSPEIGLELLNSQDDKVDHWIEYVRRTGDKGWYEHRWGRLVSVPAMLIGERLKSRLFGIVQDGRIRAARLNRYAIGVLSEMGEQRMLPHLKSVPPEENDWDAQIHMRMIEVQNPPAKLLDIINGPSEPWPSGTVVTRSWALDRAIAQGLPREDVIASIAKFFSLCLEEPDWRSEAVWLKQHAVWIGYVKYDDFPIIPYLETAGAPAGRERAIEVLRWITEGPSDAPPVGCIYKPREIVEKRSLFRPYSPPEIMTGVGRL